MMRVDELRTSHMGRRVQHDRWSYRGKIVTFSGSRCWVQWDGDARPEMVLAYGGELPLALLEIEPGDRG